MMGSYSRVANGNIAPSRFVKLDTSNQGRVLQCGAGERVYGIAQKETHNIALSGGGFTTPDDGYAAVADEMLNIYGPGDPGVLLECGGTVTQGDLLKSDSNGKGVVVASNNDFYGARALEPGTSGQLVRVEVVLGYYGA